LPEKPTIHKQRANFTEAIIENVNRTHPLSFVELAGLLGCKVRTLYSIATRLRRQGRMPPRLEESRLLTPMPEYRPPEPVTRSLLDTPPSEWDENSLAQIDKLPVLNAAQRKKLLSAIGMRPSAGVGQAAALKTLEDIDRGSGTQIGPPPPLTEAQQIERLSRLMRAVGQIVAQKAMEAAFESSEKGESPLSVESIPSSDGESNVD
jgi:hypothetical protein